VEVGKYGTSRSFDDPVEGEFIRDTGNVFVTAIRALQPMQSVFALTLGGIRRVKLLNKAGASITEDIVDHGFCWALICSEFTPEGL
jgi:hypothetical protein